VPATDRDVEALQHLTGDVVPGSRVPLPRGIESWFAECGAALHGGLVVLFDYIVDTRELLTRGHDWLRTYQAHGRGTSALVAPGMQDITADVVYEQLETAARAAGFEVVDDRSQAQWLRDLGIEDLVASGRRTWHEGAARGDLDALAGRSRGVEAAALTDPSGLGAHRVLTLVKHGGVRFEQGGPAAPEHR
jgi:SAM-dependent MidA family methyltransferase